MRKFFADFDVEQFWEPSEYALSEYVGAPLTDEVVADFERDLGYKLPASCHLSRQCCRKRRVAAWA